MQIGDIIRRRRTDMGLSVRTLGEKIGVSGSAVSQWEGGGNITWENRVLLAQALAIPLIDLLPQSERKTEIILKAPDEILLVESYRKADPGWRRLYLDMLVLQVQNPPSG